MDPSYKLQSCESSPRLTYFIKHPITDWSFDDFHRSFNNGKQRAANLKKLKNTYLELMEEIQTLDKVPDFVKTEVQRLISNLHTPAEEPRNINFNTTAHDSRVFNTTGPITVNYNSQEKSKERNVQHKKSTKTDLTLENSTAELDVEKSGEEVISEGESDSCEESDLSVQTESALGNSQTHSIENSQNSSIDIQFASDLSKDYHPLVNDGEYLLDNNEDDGNQDIIWEELRSLHEVLRNFRSVSLKIEPKSLSDMRLL